MTQHTIPVIPFETQGFGDNFGRVTDDEAMDLIRYAVDRGVNHFDSARCYGNSLRKLGMAIKEGVVRRDEIILSGRGCCHSAAPDYSAERVLADVEDQLKILGIDHFDVLFIPDPIEIGPTLVPDGTLEGLERAREKGWVDFIGYGMNDQEFHLAVIGSGRTDALLTFSDYNLLRQTAAETVLPAAAAKDIGVINGWSIMRGWLTGAPVESCVGRDRWEDDHHRAEAMRHWCRKHRVNMLALALQFCLRETRIHGNPIGSLDKEQLDANIAAVQTDVHDEIIEAFTTEKL